MYVLLVLQDYSKYVSNRSNSCLSILLNHVNDESFKWYVIQLYNWNNFQTRNTKYGSIYIVILDATYLWYYKILANMPHIEIVLACQLFWINLIMNTVHYLAFNNIFETSINIETICVDQYVLQKIEFT